MKTIDTYLNELPEPERTLCLEARAKAKKRSPKGYHDAQASDSMADAIMFGFSWDHDGGSYDKFSAIHRRVAAGEFDKRGPAKQERKRDAKGRFQGTAKKAAPKKMAADPLAERMEAMFTDVMDHLALIESSLAVIRSGATFMQELEQDAPKGLEPGDYTDASKEVADELTAMGFKWFDDERSYFQGIYYNKYGPFGMGNFGEEIDHPGKGYMDRPTFLARARVTAQELGLKAVEPEVWVPKVGDWVVVTAKSGICASGHISQICRIGPQGGIYLNSPNTPGGNGVERKKLRPATPEEIAAHEAAQEQARVPKFGDRVEYEDDRGWKVAMDVAAIAALRAAGDAMLVQLQAMALDYRDAMLAKGGSSDLHPAHAEPMQAWTDLTTKTEQP